MGFSPCSQSLSSSEMAPSFGIFFVRAIPPFPLWQPRTRTEKRWLLRCLSFAFWHPTTTAAFPLFAILTPFPFPCLFREKKRGVREKFGSLGRPCQAERFGKGAKIPSIPTFFASSNFFFFVQKKVRGTFPQHLPLQKERTALSISRISPPLFFVKVEVVVGCWCSIKRERG